jgi:hypothetical protein
LALGLAITEMSEAGASDATIMQSPDYSHVRMAAKRDVLSKLESGLMEIPIRDAVTKTRPRKAQ